MAENAMVRAWRGLFRRPRRVQPIAQLGAGGPAAGISTARETRRSQSHPLINANPTQVHSALINAIDHGLPEKLQDLFDDMRDRDPRVDSVCRTRVLTIASRPWSVNPPPGYESDKDAQRVAADVETIVRRIRSGGGITNAGGGGWRTALSEIADGILRSYSVSEIEWGVTPEGWRAPVRIHWRHPNRITFTDSLELRIRTDESDYYGTPLDCFGPDKFVVHAPTAGRAGYPMRRGVMFGMLFPSLAKRYGLRWWLQAAERWGVPVPIAILPENSGDNANLREQAQDALNRMKSTWSLVMYGGVKVEKFGGEGSFDVEVFSTLVERADMDIAIQGLGQNLTTEVKGGSYAAATAHNLVRMDLHAGDLAELDDTITNQLIEPIVRYNWPGAPVPVYETEIDTRGDVTLDDVQAGIFTPNEYRSRKGFGPKEDRTGDEYAGGPVIDAGEERGEGGADVVPLALRRR